MKRLLSVVLSAAMTLSGVVCFAENGSETERILRSVKERIGSTEKYDKFESSQSEYNGRKRYDFNWHTSDENDYSSMNVTADENGVILNFSEYENSDYNENEKTTINKMNSDEAMKRTEELLDSLNPSLAGKFALEKRGDFENLYSDSFYFTFHRTENGIEVYGDDGSVRYNPLKDKITNFDFSYSAEPECKPVENPLSVEDAQKSYMEKLGLKLVYKSFYDRKDGTSKRRFVPVYVQAGGDREYINALTGEVEKILTPDYIMFARDGASGGSAKNAMAEQASLTDAERGGIEKVNGLLSKDALIKKIKENKYINIPSDMKNDNYSLYMTQDEKYYANIGFSKRAKDDYSSVSVVMDAKTGEIENFYSSRANDDKNKNKIAADRAKTLADEIAKYMSGNKFGEYRAENGTEYDDDRSNGSFVYTRYVNDTPVEDDRIYIGLNMTDGKLESYSINYSEESFPPVDSVVGIDAAAKTLFENIGYRIVYMPQMSSEDKDMADLYVPVYMLESNKPIIIDAVSGKLLNYNGEEYTEVKPPVYNDLDGHYAENAIYALAKYGIYFEGESFRPDENVKQSDFISLLVSAFYDRGRVYRANDKESVDDAYRQAERSGIISKDEINRDAAVSREQAAVFMIRALGIGEYASLDGIYKSLYPDVTSNVGAISILSAMKVFRGDENGNFNPSKEISRADSAMIIYNYLTR